MGIFGRGNLVSMWGPKRLYNSVSLLERCSVWVCDLGEGSVHLRMSLWGLVVSVCWREWLSLPLSVTRQWRGLAQMLEPNVRIHHGRDLGPVSKARRACYLINNSNTSERCYENKTQ